MLYEDYEELEEVPKDRDEMVLTRIRNKKKKNKAVEINVMNKKRLSRWELDEYMSEVDNFEYFDR